MHLNLLALMATACASALLGVAAYLRSPGRFANRLFAVNALCMTAWVLVTCGIQVSADEATVRLLLRLAHALSALVLVTFVDFVWVFPERLGPGPSRPRLLLYLSGALFGAVGSLPQVIRALELTPTGPRVQFGWPLGALALWAFPLVIHANAVLWHKARSLRGVAGVQVLYVFAGTLTSEVIVIATNVLLPMATGDSAYSRWGVVGYLVTASAIAVAIAKHRLWDMGTAAQRVAAALLTALLGILGGGVMISGLGPWVATLATGMGQQAVIWMALGGGLGLCLVPMYHAFRGLLDRFLQDEQERVGHLVSALGAAIVHATPGEDSLRPILTETQRFFNCSFAAAYLRRGDGSYETAGVVSADGDRAVEADPLPPSELPPEVTEALGADVLANVLDAGYVARFGTASEASRILGAMDAVGASLIAPIRWEGETIGLLCVGPKLSRGMYTHPETEILKSVAAHAAIAVKNAELRALIVAEKEQTEKVLAQMESGVVTVDTAKRIQLVNPAACALLAPEGERLSAEQLVGRPMTVLPGELQRLLNLALVEQTTVSGQRVTLNLPRRLRVACSTFVIWPHVHQALRGASPRLGREVRCEGAGIVFRDLSTEDALRAMEAETERLKFIHAVSAGLAHEIRNPLVAIRTFAELAPVRLDDPEFRDSFLQVAQSEVARLEELVSQFMTMAKPSAVIREPVDLHELAHKTVTALMPRAHSQQVSIRTRIEPDLPTFKGDDGRLQQALMNLLLNALDATPPGGEIELRAEAAREAQGHPTDVLITVWNSGSYIPPEDIDHVFEPFFTSKPDGTGLGLAICQTIASEHSGEISVVSSPESGTAFTLRIPVAGVRERIGSAAMGG